MHRISLCSLPQRVCDGSGKELDHKSAVSARTENFEKHLGIGAIYQRTNEDRINIIKMKWTSLVDYRHLMNENKHLISYLNNERQGEKTLKIKSCSQMMLNSTMITYYFHFRGQSLKLECIEIYSSMPSSQLVSFMRPGAIFFMLSQLI